MVNVCQYSRENVGKNLPIYLGTLQSHHSDYGFLASTTRPIESQHVQLVDLQNDNSCASDQGMFAGSIYS